MTTSPSALRVALRVRLVRLVRPLLLPVLAPFLMMACATAPACAGKVLDRVRSQSSVRVCIWPAYYGITYLNPRTEKLQGIDIDLSTEFARGLGVKLVYVNSSFASLVDDLQQEHCEVSMHAVGITPQRQKSLAFTQPYLQSDIYGVTTRINRKVRRWGDIDQPGVRVAVQAGTLMEPVMAASLRKAELVVVHAPGTREEELEAGRVDVFMTDMPYSRRLLDRTDWACVIEPFQPFHLSSYGYAVKPGDEDWLREVDAFVTAIKRDGRLKAAAARHGLADMVLTR